MWTVATTDIFDEWFRTLGDEERAEIEAKVNLLELFGPALGRPHADTLNGSTYPNMKELRADIADQTLRIAFAFDPERAAILLVGGDKRGQSQHLFYRQLIAKADILYAEHLTTLKTRRKRGEK
ncbi:MAG: type II toxin-antitoxin system RelE/ParE family toxin [Planctomycetota bacterium]